MQKLYRININHFEDPLKNERLLDLVGIRRREKVIRYRMPDDRKVWVQGSSSEKSSMKTGLRKAAWDILTMKSRLWMAFFNVSHAGTMLWVCCQTAKSGAILRKMPMRLLRWQNIISTIQSLLTSRLRRTKIRRFYALDIKRKLYENDRQRNEPSFGFFWSGSHSRWVCPRKILRKAMLFETMEFDGYIFSVSSERAFSLHNPLEIVFDDIYVWSQMIFQTRSRVSIRQESVYVRYCFCCNGELRKASEQVNQV